MGVASLDPSYDSTANMRSIEAVNAQCPTCSARQGGFLSNFSKNMRQLLGF
jgi:hypothetical protein